MAPSSALAGTSSCSARGCHGRIGPLADQAVRQNEYSFWLTHDKHAQAYEVLLGPRARRMAKNLAPTNPDGKEVPAHKDTRCLACHSDPLTAAADRDDLHRDGVGCEACHGPASGPKPWLDLHTTHAWKDFTNEQKATYGMKPLADPAVEARVCAGCHVGAPAGSPDPGVPARDLNHDLMAAGHPRLDFELTSFQVNMPPHWRTDKYDKKDPGREARLWAVGQVVCARASLELLRARAAEGTGEGRHPWPEFAEYGCFACHSDLRGKSWREPGYDQGHKPGALPYNVWFSTCLPVLVPDRDDPLLRTFADLGREMGRPYGNQKQVGDLADKGIGQLNTLLGKTKDAPYDRDTVRTLLARLAARARQGPRNAMTWDEMEQLVLAVAALSQADRTLARVGGGQPVLKDQQVEKQLRALFGMLAFPAGSESPREFRSQVHPDEEFQGLLKLLPGS
jgi:hypothetical protein